MWVRFYEFLQIPRMTLSPKSILRHWFPTLLGTNIKRLIYRFLLLSLVYGLSACSPEAQTRLTKITTNQAKQIELNLSGRDSQLGDPVFIRIVKTVDGSLQDGYLELFLENNAGEFELYKSWPICSYSGDLGPKLKEGDGQSPEGFYFIRPSQMNPNSSYHLSFNLGFPNAFDRAHGRTGSFLMVHGNCVSIGCYAMTDPVIEEIYSIMTAAFDAGQPFIRVHAFPFPMTENNLSKYQSHADIDYWRNLKSGWDHFEIHNRPPDVTVRKLKYHFSID